MKKITAILLAGLLFLSGCDAAGNAFVTTTESAETVDLRPEAPNFVGLTLEQVQMRYPSLNIRTEYRSDDTAAETVLEQDIPAGEKYDEGAQFTLTVSSGPKPVEIDDYVGRSIEDAQTLLEKQGFLCEIVREESDSVPENCVTRTSPAAREKALPGSTVICYVSMGSGKTEITVPRFIGLTVEEASLLAAENGIGLTIGYDKAPDAVPGTVLRQGIDEGTVVEPNTRVEITIAGEASPTAGKQPFPYHSNQALSANFS